jgi:hypothetical protein
LKNCVADWFNCQYLSKNYFSDKLGRQNVAPRAGLEPAT